MSGRERGSALVLALLVLALAASTGALLLERGRGLEASTRHDREQLEALYAAEGGLAHARHALARDRGYAGETIRVGRHAVSIAVQERGDEVEVVTRAGGVRLVARLRPGKGLPRVVAWRSDPAAGG